MAASTPTVPSVAGDDGMKMGSFNVTPAGPLDAAYALSPVSTGAFASSESSPSKRFWEARARAWTSGEEESTTGAFGSVAPSTKTFLGSVRGVRAVSPAREPWRRRPRRYRRWPEMMA